MKPCFSVLALSVAILAATPVGDLIGQEKPRPGPTKLLAVQTGPNEITLVWQADPRAREYVVYGPRKKADLNGAGVQLGRISGSGTRYVARVVSPGAEHHYALQAVRKGGTSKRLDFNPVVPTAGSGSAKIDAPAAVQAELTNPGVVTIRWDAVPGATAYSIGRSVRPSGFRPLCDLCDPKRTRYVDREAVAGRVHVYTVATVTPAGRSRVTRSNEVTPTGSAGPGDVASEDSIPPGGDSTSADSLIAGNSKGAINLKAGLKSSNTVLLTWTGLLPGHRYSLTRRIPDAGPVIIATITSTLSQYLDRLPLGIGGQVGYSIEDLNGKGASNEALLTLDSGKAAADTSGGAVVTDPNSKAAIDLKAGTKSGNTIELTFSGLLANHRYRIRRQIGGGLPSIVATITGSLSSYLDHLQTSIRDRIGYVIEDLDGKGASNQVFVTLNSASIDSAKARTDSAGSWPKGPSNLRATVLSPGTVRLDWTLPISAELAGQMMPYIRIYRGLENGALVLIGSVSPGLASFIDHLQGNIMDATYAIEAVYEKGPSERATVSIDPRKDRVAGAGSAADTTGGKGAANPVPKGPTDVAAVLNAPNAVTLTWNPLPGETYEIRRSIGTGVPQLIATIASAAGQYVDELPPAGSKDNVVVYRIRNTNDKLAAPIVVTVDQASGTSETIEDQGLDSLRTRGRGKVP